MNKNYYELQFIALDKNGIPATRAIEKILDEELALEEFNHYSIPGCIAKLYLVNDKYGERYLMRSKVVKGRIEINLSSRSKNELNEEQQKAYENMILGINYYVDAKYANLLIERLDDLMEKMQNGQ